MVVQAFVIVSSLAISLLLLFVDVTFIMLSQYTLLKLQIKEPYLNILMIVLTFISLLKFLSFLAFIPIIAYLVYIDIDILRAINIAASTSFIKLRDEYPWLIGIIIAIYMIYFSCVVIGNIITSSLIEQLNRLIEDNSSSTVVKLGLKQIKNYILIIKNVDNVSFVLFLIFTIITALISLFDYFYQIEKKQEN